jgi:hypothetical protein
MKQINLRLTELTLAAIDELRGDAPRNTWIARAVDEKVAREGVEALNEQLKAEDRQRKAGNTGVAGGTKGASPVPEKYDHPFKSRGGNKPTVCFTCGQEHS